MYSNKTILTDNTSSSVSFEFIVLLIVEILSILCTLLILVYFFSKWNVIVKKIIRNHIIQILVIISFINITIDLPFTINAYRLGYDQPRTISFCLWWYWLDYTLIITSIFLTATASIQRHLLIFNAYWFQIHFRRLLIHYIPILFCLIYPTLFYFIVIIVYPCDYSDLDENLYCLNPCYTNNPILFNYDWIFNTTVPLSIIALANLTLVIRTVYSMKTTRQEQVLTWKRQRQLTLQLVILSSLYIIGWAPSTLISVIQTLSRPNLFNDLPYLQYSYYLTYFVCPLQPFVCLFDLPELTKKLQVKFRQCRTRNQITPISPF